MSKDVECPYCGCDQEICHDDGYGYERDMKHIQSCFNCEKEFVFTTEIYFYYESEKADCLNGGDHNYEPNKCYPREYTKMVCTMCDDTRNPTKEEMIKILK